MNTIIRNLAFSFALLLHGLLCDAQIMYSSRFDGAVSAELFGVSPIMSVNYEKVLKQNLNSFYSVRGGFGYLPAANGNGAGFSIPIEATYNKKLLLAEIMGIKLLNTFPRRFQFEPFLQGGIGYARIIYPGGDQRNYYNLVLKIRGQFIIKVPPKPKIFFLSVGVNPRVRRRGLVFYESTPGGGENFYGGLSVGMGL